jgi:hypothetical protein
VVLDHEYLRMRIQYGTVLTLTEPKRLLASRPHQVDLDQPILLLEII